MAIPWPLPALGAWAAAWALFVALPRSGAGTLPAFVLAALLGGALALLGATRWRRLIIAAGFPLSLAASGLVALPGWAWLLPLVLLATLYPLNAWRDAPLFPTPPAALQGLAARAPLPPVTLVIDAGCGLGDGLLALRREYPQAQLLGLEWSWPLRLACALRCRFARVRRADLWAADWSGAGLVYLFQRPESMGRAFEKACRELPEGAWLASLEFAVPGVAPHARLEAVAGKPLWLYRLGAPARR